MNGSNNKADTIDHIAAAAIMVVALLILGTFAMTAKSSPLPLQAATVAMSSQGILHVPNTFRRVLLAPSDARPSATTAKH